MAITGDKVAPTGPGPGSAATAKKGKADTSGSPTKTTMTPTVTIDDVEDCKPTMTVLDREDTISTLSEGPGEDEIDPVTGQPIDGGEDDDGIEREPEEPCPFKYFTEASYEACLARYEERRRHEQEQKDTVQEGRLVDGELKFGDDDDDEPPPDRDISLIEGNTLPLRLDHNFPKEMLGKPIEEIDPYLKDKTYVIITPRFKRKYISRFSATPAFFILKPWHPIRKAAGMIATHQAFDYFIILTILVNCVFLTMSGTSLVLVISEYVFLAIYSLEMCVKLLARGFFINTYTYLRDAWNWLDFTVIVMAFLTIIMEEAGMSNALGNINGLRTFRVLRAFKTISIVPGLKTIISALLKSMRMLMEVIVLTLFCMMVFALFALQVYIGILRQKCVADIPPELNTDVTHEYYMQWIKDEAHWFVDPIEGDFLLCGNATNAGLCPTNYTCLPDIGDNPNFGYTNFDNFAMALLNSFQLITLDYWEDPYNKVIRANGPWNIFFFVVVVFFGSFYLINLMLAVVSMSYEEEATQAGKAAEGPTIATMLTGNGPHVDEVIVNVVDYQKDQEKKEKKKEKNQNSSKNKNVAKNKKDKKNKEDKSETDTNHLKVVSNLGDNNSNSCTSLKSMGNGHLKSGEATKAANSDTTSKAKTSAATTGGVKTATTAADKSIVSKAGTDKKDLTSGAATKGAVSVGIDMEPVSESVHTTQDSGMGSSEKMGDAETTGAKMDPMATVSSDDSQSITSSENQGDPPVVVIRDDDEELVVRNCECCGHCCCLCYIPWLRFQNVLFRIVSDIVFELIISFCILLNVLVLALDYHNRPQLLADICDGFNYLFMGVFLLEAIMKITAMPLLYWRSAWNVFDFLIVLASLIDVSLESVDGISIIRLLRLLRVFKLAQTWSTMRLLLSIVMRTLGALGNLTFILGIVIYIFAVIGMQLFSDSYTVEKFGGEAVPRWNFTDFPHSLVLIFRILCGEWIEPLWECMIVANQLCTIVFFPTLIFGNFVVLNLFLALMLNSFATDSLKKKEDVDNSKMKQGWKKLKGLFKSNRPTVQPQDNVKKKPSIADIIDELKRQKAMLAEQEAKNKEAAEIEGASDNPPKDIELTSLSGSDSAGGSPDKKPDDDVTKSYEGSNTLSPKANGLFNPPKEMDAAFMTERNKFSQFPGTITVSPKADAEKGPTSMTKVEENSKSEGKILADDGERKKSGLSLFNFGSGKRKSSSARHRTPTITISEADDDEDEANDSTEADKSGEIADCFPYFCEEKCCPCFLSMENKRFGQEWHTFRSNVHKVTEHKAFEYFVLSIIILSSITLCFEDIYLVYHPVLQLVLYWLNVVFAVLFTLEMFLKWIGIGFKRYFTSFWTVLDFCIVVISLVSIAAEALGLSSIASFRALRTLRALRPLRAISRWQGMRIVVNALVYAIPAIMNVLLVCLVFWLIFSIAGVQLFAGTFYKCLDEDGEKISNTTLIPDKMACLNVTGYVWENANVTFDDVAQGFLALLQVATFEGWMEVMEDAVDSVGVDMQPRFEASFWAYIFFGIFIVVGSFFTLNLFIGVIIDNFNMLKKKYEGSYLDAFLTPTQKKYYNTMKKLGNRKPQKTIKRPKNRIQGFFFDVAVSTKFELAIVMLIFANMIAMTVEHYQQSQAYTDTLDIINIVFTTIFTLECIVKLIGLRWHYFRRAWNVFDFIIVILSLLGVILDDLLSNIFITPTLLRVVRVFRIGRVLRLIKAAKGIRKLLFALVISLPALFNIGMLLVLIIFIYAIFGMAFFGNVKRTAFLNDMVNFETFFNSVVLLFRLTTAAGWNDVLGPLMNNNNCNTTHVTKPNGDIFEVAGGDCADATISVMYMTSYIILTYLIIINMYIAVILENFNQAHEQEEVGITEDDFEMFYIVWERYDPHATQFIKYEHLSSFVADLDQPLGMPKPNEIALVAFDLTIVEGERLHCLDILIPLVKHVLGGVDESGEFATMKRQMEEKFREQFPTRVTQVTISSTMRRKKEDVAARTLQRAWRKHKAQQSIRKITEMAMEAQLNRSLTRTSFSQGTPSPRRGSNANSRPASAASLTASQPNSKLGNALRVPTVNEINLPSDKDNTDLKV